eukprot:gene55332-34766_t
MAPQVREGSDDDSDTDSSVVAKRVDSTFRKFIKRNWPTQEWNDIVKSLGEMEFYELKQVKQMKAADQRELAEKRD